MISHRGIRYLLAGVCNTLFGICDTLAMIRLFLLLVPSHPKFMATAAMLCSSFCNIAFSFLTYKLFVFRTRGNYLTEYLRSLVIYLPGIAINTLLLAPLSIALSFANKPIENLSNINGGSVYLASMLLIGTTFILSFFGHKHFSFRVASNHEDIPD